jgi:small subunit ribosomal protein S27Ae
MRIWLNQIDGTSSQITISNETSFESLLEQCNLSSARLICQGSQIDASNYLDLLSENANVYVTGDLDGGKKKKKKKVYTTKKKNKHIHKRVKLSIYTLYSVDGTFIFTQEKET